MSTRVGPGEVLLVELNGATMACEELESTVQQIQDRDECDVVVDLEDATILTSRSLTSLMHLRELLRCRGRRLVLCCLGEAGRGVFAVTELDRIFEIVDDRSTALAAAAARPDSALVESIGSSANDCG